MSDIVKNITDLESMRTEDLIRELKNCIEISVAQIVRMAQIVRILEDRGHDLADIRLGMLSHLRLVAYGQLLPEALAKLQGSPFLLKRVASLPIPDQRKIIEADAVEVVTPENPSDYRTVPLLALGRSEIFQVFADGALRDAGAQRSYLRDHHPIERKPTATDGERVVFDRKRGGFLIKGEFFSRKELTQLLARLEE